ncbi:hypothetical protein GF325_18710, partial [Candidatus Bathyarchaeota archaeon]|nr:hypothetical protein [Candidatus Bathyarchaeota archaeon]
MLQDTILFPQTIVTIAGREAKVRLINAGNHSIEIKHYPDCVEPLHMFIDGKDLVLTLLGKSYSPEREKIIFYIDSGENGTERTIPVRTLTDREFFIVFCLQANFHIGWDPSWLPQYYPELRNGKPMHVAKQEAGVVGEQAFGSSYMYLYENSDCMKKGIDFVPLEKIYHDHGIPISWLIDQHVANEMAGRIISWSKEHGDTYSILPTSYSYDNAVNYNIEKTAEDAKSLLQGTRYEVMQAFIEHDYPRYPNTCGIDQWVGSIGSNFVKAAIDLGFKGVWGMGWDHLHRNTSMFHRGAPWNAYKPSRFQFRIPSRKNEKFELFLFQWTVRDLVNTLHLSPHGSAIFSTDPDDLRLNGIINQEKPHYILELLYNYSRNMKYNDYFVFLIHQEDHDAHFKENNQFFLSFIEALQEDEPPGLTYATLDEVAQWLAIKYPDNKTPSQILELEDPLLPWVKQEVMMDKEQAINQVYDPDDEIEKKRVMAEHFPKSEKLPLHVAYFNRDMLLLGYKPYHIPFLYWDYTRLDEWSVPEDGQYPPENLPKINLIDENAIGGYEITFTSTKYFAKLPWIVWKPKFSLKEGVPGTVAK